MDFSQIKDKISISELAKSVVSLLKSNNDHINNKDIHISEEERRMFDALANINIIIATHDSMGIMSKEDKIKLDSISYGAKRFKGHAKLQNDVSKYGFLITTMAGENAGHASSVSSAIPIGVKVYANNAKNIISYNIDQNGESSIVKLRDSDFFIKHRPIKIKGSDIRKYVFTDDSYDGTSLANSSELINKVNSVAFTTTYEEARPNLDSKVFYYDKNEDKLYIMKDSSKVRVNIPKDAIQLVDGKIPKKYINEDILKRRKPCPIGTVICQLSSTPPPGYVPLDGREITLTPEMADFLNNNIIAEKTVEEFNKIYTDTNINVKDILKYRYTASTNLFIKKYKLEDEAGDDLTFPSYYGYNIFVNNKDSRYINFENEMGYTQFLYTNSKNKIKIPYVNDVFISNIPSIKTFFMSNPITVIDENDSLPYNYFRVLSENRSKVTPIIQFNNSYIERYSTSQETTFTGSCFLPSTYLSSNWKNRFGQTNSKGDSMEDVFGKRGYDTFLNVSGKSKLVKMDTRLSSPGSTTFRPKCVNVFYFVKVSDDMNYTTTASIKRSSSRVFDDTNKKVIYNSARNSLAVFITENMYLYRNREAIFDMSYATYQEPIVFDETLAGYPPMLLKFKGLSQSLIYPFRYNDEVKKCIEFTIDNFINNTNQNKTIYLCWSKFYTDKENEIINQLVEYTKNNSKVKAVRLEGFYNAILE